MSCHIASRCGVIRWYHNADPRTAFAEREPFKASASYFQMTPTTMFISNLISHDGQTMRPEDYRDMSAELAVLGVKWVQYDRNGRMKMQHVVTMDIFDLEELIARQHYAGKKLRQS